MKGDILSFFDIDKEVISASEKAMELCKDKFAEIEDIQEYNQVKMIKAFQNAGVRESFLPLQQVTDMMILAETHLTGCMLLLLMPRMLW